MVTGDSAAAESSTWLTWFTSIMAMDVGIW